MNKLTRAGWFYIAVVLFSAFVTYRILERWDVIKKFVLDAFN